MLVKNLDRFRISVPMQGIVFWSILYTSFRPVEHQKAIKWELPGAKGNQKGAKREPKGCQREAKGEPKGNQNASKN